MLFITYVRPHLLIIQSNKSEAKPFRRWVTHDVLPSIRKYGSYETEETASEVVTRPQLAKVAFRVKQVAVRWPRRSVLKALAGS